MQLSRALILFANENCIAAGIDKRKPDFAGAK